MLFLMKISSFFPVMPAVVGLFALSACGHIITKSHTYQKSQAVEIHDRAPSQSPDQQDQTK